MAKVLTRSEYKARTTTAKKATITETGGVKAPPPAPVLKEDEGPKKLTILVHPDGEAVNYEDTVQVNGVEKRRVCQAGVVKTTDPALAGYLVGIGYQILDEITEG